MNDRPLNDQPYRLILASASARRGKLLEALGLEFDVVASGIDESRISAPTPRDLAIETAKAKAEAVAASLPTGDQPRLIIAADTIVVLDNETLGKPNDRDHAAAMLAKLSGRTHDVITGLALAAQPGNLWLDAERTEVAFHPLDRATIERYVASGQADDKAGAYGVQELGVRAIAAVKGDLSNVIGLPLGLLRTGLARQIGKDILAEKDLRNAVLTAFPDLAPLPPEFWRGIPD